MPRSRSIPWEKRVLIFLEYRKRDGRVLPTADAHGISRTAVRTIVEQFRREGFSPAPRANLSPSLLRRLQEQHVLEIEKRLSGVRNSLSLNIPDEYTGFVAPTPEGPAGIYWPEVDEYLLWHLKGTDAETVLTEARGALTAYSRRYNELWAEIRHTLGEETGLPVLDQDNPKGPCLYATAVDLVYQEVFRRARGGASLTPGKNRWVSGRDDKPSALSVQLPEASDRTQVAFGGLPDHENVQRVLESWLVEPPGPVIDECRELAALYHDLLYLGPIVEDALGRVRQEDIGRGLCPDCPYPEVLLEQDDSPTEQT